MGVTGPSQKIRVLQLGSPMGLYGAERWILALAKYLDREKIESVVAAIKDAPHLDTPLCREAESLGIRAHVFEVHGRCNLSVVMQLRSFIIQNRVDILHTHVYKQDITGLLAAQGTNCKIVSTPHGWSKHCDFKLWCYEALNRVIFPFFDAVCPLSEELYQPLVCLPGMKRKLWLIRNAVDTLEIDNHGEINSTMLQWKKEGAVVIGYVGQLIPRKGLDVLLRAMAMIDGMNWRLAIVGDGGSRFELESLSGQLGLSEKVHFFGYRKDRLGFLRGFDIFVLPSRLEGIPRCLMEAMAANVPVVASDIPGCRQLIFNGKTGILFSVDRPESLAKAIVQVGTDPYLAKSLAGTGFDFVHREFSMARVAREYESLFLSLVGSQTSGRKRCEQIPS
jgi:glycosyltransferase involved in cell wall biosynthesis